MRIAIVSGASSGMGREFVKQLPWFYRELDEIWITARRKGRLISLAKTSRIPCRIFEGNLLENKVYSEILDALEKEKPDVRMLVNAAGFGKMGTAAEIAEREPEAQQEMIDLNCRALTRLTMTCLPFLTQGSRIVNLASAAAFCPQPYFAVYAATKSYVLSFSQALGAELIKNGIYVTAVCPGPVDTEFFDVSGRLPHKWKDAVMAAPEKVVHQALIDSRKKKPVSVYGLAMKAADLGAKLLPHNMIIKIESMGKD